MAKEYIERDVAIEKTETFCDVFVTNWTDEKVLAWIKNLPAVDVVEVVRCRDCKHWHEEKGWCDKHSHFIKYGTYGEEFCHPWESAEWKMFDADYFCADGERRADNDR